MDILKSILTTVAPGLASMLAGPAAGAVIAMLGNKLLGNGNASVNDIVAALSDPATVVKLKELDIQLAQAQASVDVAQASVNQEDAASDDKFKSYWRPATAWFCLIALAYSELLYPILSKTLASIGIEILQIDSSGLMTLLLGLLGLGTMRTFERIKGK